MVHRGKKTPEQIKAKHESERAQRKAAADKAPKGDK